VLDKLRRAANDTKKLESAGQLAIDRATVEAQADGRERNRAIDDLVRKVRADARARSRGASQKQLPGK
jgi:hypothetical protein